MCGINVVGGGGGGERVCVRASVLMRYVPVVETTSLLERERETEGERERQKEREREKG